MSFASAHGAGRLLRVALALWALIWVTGCATSGAGTRYASSDGTDLSQDGGGGGFWEEPDGFQLLQRSAGLEEDSWLQAGVELEADDARELWEALARTRTTLQNFGPCRTLVFLLRQVIARDEDVPYAELLRRIGPFQRLEVMRPDGYLVSAITGRALQRMGRVELREGRLMAGSFEVGAFYRNKGGVFYPVDDSLQPSGGLIGELGLEHDWFNAALDGSQDALGEVGLALARFVTSPVRSIEGLEQLPTAVAALIASSPDYFARYSSLPLQEQIREAARLSTHLLMLYGSAGGTATRVAAVGAELPVLSLTAEGTLAIEQVVVPVGATTAVLGTSVGAVYVLMEGSTGGDKDAGRVLKPFTASNFRENLARLTGQMPEGAHAHHVFPQEFEEKFQKVGLNIHDPKFGAWWQKSSHLRNAFKYNEAWREFLRHNPTLEQILQYGRELGGEFGFQVNF